MAKFGKFSPSRSYPDLNTAMMSLPILPNHSRDPRISDPWNLQERKNEILQSFHHFQKHIPIKRPYNRHRIRSLLAHLTLEK